MFNTKLLNFFFYGFIWFMIFILIIFFNSEITHDSKNKEAFLMKYHANVISVALNLYKLDNSNYPTKEQGINALFEIPKIEPIPKNYNKVGYIQSIPNDPWGNIYKFEIINSNSSYYVLMISSGKDEIIDTKDDNIETIKLEI